MENSDFLYKVILADDEILTREAISENTPWAEAGFELIGAAENGKEVISLIEKEEPDLLVTDICMPIMDGIQLSGYIHDNYPDMKVVIISGYDEFDYAKKALKYGVIEYILKPITSYELKDELLKIKAKLDSEIRKKRHVEKIQKAYEKNIPMLQARFLNRLLEGSYIKNDIKSQMERHGIEVEGKYQSVVFVGLENAAEFIKEYPASGEELLKFAIFNIASEIVSDLHSGIAFQGTDDKSVIIFSSETEADLQKKIQITCDKIIEAMKQFMKTRVYIIIGEAVMGPENWQNSFENAKYAEECKFLLEEHIYIFGKDFVSKKENPRIQTNFWIEKIVLLIKLNQKEELKQIITGLFEEFRGSRCERKTIFLHLQNMVLTILITLEESDADLGEDFQVESTFINHMAEYKHLSEVQEKFETFCLKLSNSIAGKRENSIQKQAVLALDYIEKNYMNDDMSLNTVCDYLSVSVSYFSMIFKNYTGETFVEVLTRVRIDKAKKLFETTSMKNYEVAMEVGYNDPHYFSATFKKQTGKTPTEYAKSVREGN